MPRERTGERRRENRIFYSVMAISDRSLKICGCRRIVKYTAEEIRVRLADTPLRVRGSFLTVNTLRGDEIEIRGRIRGLDFDLDADERGEGGESGC